MHTEQVKAGDEAGQGEVLVNLANSKMSIVYLRQDLLPLWEAR